MSVSDGPASKTPKPLSVSRPRLLGFVGMALIVVLLFVLPPLLSRQLFLIVIVAAITYGLTMWRMREQLRRLDALQDAQTNAVRLPVSAVAVSTSPRKPDVGVVRWLLSNRPVRARQMLLIALTFLVLAAFGFRPAVPREELGLGILFMVMGVAALGVALWVAQKDDALPLPTALDYQVGGVNWVLLTVGAAMLFVAAEISGNMMGTNDLDQITIHFQFAMFVGGTIAVTWGLSGIGIPSLTLLGWRMEKKEFLLIVVLTLAALALRLVNLDNGLRAMIHEDFFADIANSIRWSGYQFKLLVPYNDFTPQPVIFSYLQLGAAALFGHTLFGLRAISAILATLTIPGIYLLARSLANRHVAIIAALFLVTLPPHVHISRLALPSIVDPLFGTLAIAFIARGLRSNRQSDFAIGGAALGLSQYWVDAGRVFFPLLLILWLGIGLYMWRPQPSLRGLLIAVAAFALVGMPYYYAVSGVGAPLFPRIENAGTTYWLERFTQLGFLDGSIELLQSISNSFLHYVHFPEVREAWLYYGGEQPLIIIWLVPFLVLGVGYALWRWRKPAGLLLVLWLVVAALGIGFSRASGTSIRFTVAFPALALALAFGVYYPLTILIPRYQRAALVLVVTVITVGQAGYYFGIHLPTYNRQLREFFGNCGGSADTILRSQDFPRGTNIYLISPRGICDQHEANALLQFMRDDMTLVVVGYEYYTDSYFENQVPRNVDSAFFVWADDQEMIDRISRYFRLDEPQYSDFPEPAPGITFVLYYAHAEPQFGPMRLVQR